jgi:tRNA-2-methylthio-N6-dimethylallyladenosine synthase
VAGFVIKTFGCQFNELYSATIAEALLQGGHHPVTELGDASLVVVNTCAVREKAEEKAFSFLGEAAKVVGARNIVFMGCTATIDRDRAVRIAGRGLRVVDGASDVERALDQVGEVLPLGSSTCTPSRTLFPTASIELVRGCESYCTYCIVPRARGREVMVPEEQALALARDAVGNGFSELLFLGQNINRFRAGGRGLTDLLRSVDMIDGDFWFWFLSSHPANFTQAEVLQIMRLQHAEHRLHLPLQSGSDRVLGRMNRRYSVDDYARLADSIRADNSWTLTTDIIVGFPGETDEDFDATVAAVRRFRFEAVYLAKYSDRPGTPSSRMPDKVPGNIIDERHSALLQIVQELGEQANQELVGQSVDVIVLSSAPDGSAFGKSRDGRNVWFSWSTVRPDVGTFVRAAVEHSSREGLYGGRVA